MTVRELSRTTAIVTGASKGFGRATAIALAGRGAHVVGMARSEPNLDQLRQELETGSSSRSATQQTRHYRSG